LLEKLLFSLFQSTNQREFNTREKPSSILSFSTCVKSAASDKIAEVSQSFYKSHN